MIKIETNFNDYGRMIERVFPEVDIIITDKRDIGDWNSWGLCYDQDKNTIIIGFDRNRLSDSDLKDWYYDTIRFCSYFGFQPNGEWVDGEFIVTGDTQPAVVNDYKEMPLPF